VTDDAPAPGAAWPAGVALRPLRRTDAGWVLARHAALYARDEGFDARFAADVEAALSEFFAGAPGDRGWIAEAASAADGAGNGAAPVGSILCVGAGAGAARVRLFLLEPEWRARGLGRLMLETCLAHARATGRSRLLVGTYDSHRAAGRLYARAGFALVAIRPLRRYGRDLVEQSWEKRLD
jgi:GNAT superfamily N-acetyltransferase